LDLIPGFNSPTDHSAMECSTQSRSAIFPFFSGSKKKKRSKRKEKEVPSESEVKQNGVEVHEEQKCDLSDEKPPAGKHCRIILEKKLILGVPSNCRNFNCINIQISLHVFLLEQSMHMFHFLVLPEHEEKQPKVCFNA
jgi:hypothetical protein